MMKKQFTAICSLLCAGAGLFGDALSSADFTQTPDFVWNGETLRASAPQIPGKEVWHQKGIRISFPVKRYEGQFVRFTAQVRWVNGPAKGERVRGRLMFAVKDRNGHEDYQGVWVTPEDKVWKDVSVSFRVPEKAAWINFFLGFEKECGNFEVRNMRFESLGVSLPLEQFGNRTFRDETANDGKGGWTDQGPKSDGRIFENMLRKDIIAGVPFKIPVGNSDKSVLTMYSPTRNKNGFKSREIPVAPSYSAKYLYVIHALSYAGAPGTEAGRIVVKGSRGTQEIPVTVGRDVSDWWDGKAVPNASDVLRKTVPNEGHDLLLYVTKYPLNAELGEIRSVTFRSAENDKVWIICGATLTDREYPMEYPRARQPLTIKADKIWQPPLREEKFHYREPGSILDVSSYGIHKPITEKERIVITPEGHFVYPEQPEKPVRFFISTDKIRLGVPKGHETKEKIDEWLEDAVVHGYNMIQLYATPLIEGGIKADFAFNPTAVDLIDYLISRCREKGIYLDLILMPRRSGFAKPPLDVWKVNTRWFSPKDEWDIFFQVFFSDKARAHYEKGVTQFLDHLNPYTNTKLKDDPVILCTGGANEQEFAFYYRDIAKENRKVVEGPYRKFLKKRYNGSIAAYNAKWKTAFRSFEEIPCFSNFKKNSDVDEFIYERSCDTLRWYRSVLNKLGCRAYLGETFNFVPSLTYHFIRRELDFLGIHSYHDHPVVDTAHQINGTAWVRNKQDSCIEGGNIMARALIGSRIWRKPLFWSEYDHSFWNRYRYELSYVIGAFAAFQNIDGLAAWDEPLKRDDISKFDGTNVWKSGPMTTFSMSRDPMRDASELLNWFMFIRGDVSPAPKSVRIVADRKSVFAKNPDDTPAQEQTILSLLVGYSQESVDDPERISPAGKNELILPSLGGGKMKVENLYTVALGTTGDVSGYVDMLRKVGFLSKENRSNGSTVFENSTREWYMDFEKKYMTINTKRLQGMCAPAGSTAKLDDFEITGHSQDGNLTLVAVDGMKSIREAGRLLLVRLTNALNTNMSFDDIDMRRLTDIGTVPALMKNSKFAVRIRNNDAENLKLFPLTLEGRRTGKAISPAAVKDGTAVFSVDTAEAGNTTFFEISKN